MPPRPVDIYLQGPAPDPEVPRPVSFSQVTFSDLAEPQSQNVAGTFFGGRSSPSSTARPPSAP